MKFRRKVFTTRPGGPDARDDPAEVVGVAVARVFMRRVDRPAALVRLVDRRFAMTGDVVAVGGACDMAAYARRSALRCLSAPDRLWFRACADELLRVHPDPLRQVVGESVLA